MVEASTKGRFEILVGLTLAFAAALTLLTKLQAERYSDDEMLAHGQMASAYAWYQAKSIKETATSQELGILRALLASGTVAAEARALIQKQSEELESQVRRYQAEKKEILNGSAAVGPEGHTIAHNDGRKGAVIGALEWEKRLKVLAGLEEGFNRATLWLQLSLVYGALALVATRRRLKAGFSLGMAVSALIGAYFAVFAWNAAATFVG